MFFLGLDIGSTWTKTVLLDRDLNIAATLVKQTGPKHRKLAHKTVLELLESAHVALDEVAYLVATGYGRVNVPFADAQTTELTCHAKGVAYYFPDVGTAIDVGGQDAKALSIREGRLVNFVMNDKCAAGTGRFLEVLAETLGLELDQLGPLSAQATDPATIGSICTIFAQQELVAQLSSGVPIHDVVAGVHHAVAGRVCRLARSMGVDGEVVLTGGVAKNNGFANAVEQHLQRPVRIPPDSFITGALGAAIVAAQKHDKALEEGGGALKTKRTLGEASFYH